MTMTGNGWDVLLKVKRPDGKAFRGVGGKPAFVEADHPRDRHGRFIETGSEVRLMGGALATVLGNAGNGRVRVRRNDDQREYNVDKGSLEVTKRPDGSAPTDKPEDAPAPITAAADNPAAVDAPNGPDAAQAAADAPAAGPVTDTQMTVAELNALRMKAPEQQDPEHVAALAEKYKREGYHDGPLQVEDTNKGALLTDGHHRLAAAEQAGIETLPVRRYANTPEGRAAANRAMADAERAKEEAGPEPVVSRRIDATAGTGAADQPSKYDADIQAALDQGRISVRRADRAQAARAAKAPAAGEAGGNRSDEQHPDAGKPLSPGEQQAADAAAFSARRAQLARQADAAAAAGNTDEERRLRQQMVQEVNTRDSQVEADGGLGTEKRRADALAQGDVILERDPNSLDRNRVNEYEVSRGWENGAYYRRAQGRAGLGERVEAPAEQEFVVRPKPAPGTGSGRRGSVIDNETQADGVAAALEGMDTTPRKGADTGNTGTVEDYHRTPDNVWEAWTSDQSTDFGGYVRRVNDPDSAVSVDKWQDFDRLVNEQDFTAAQAPTAEDLARRPTAQDVPLPDPSADGGSRPPSTPDRSRGADYVPQGQGPDKGTATNPGRDSAHLTFETEDQLRDFWHMEVRHDPDRANELNDLAGDDTLRVVPPGDVAFVHADDGYRFLHARSGREIGIPHDLARNDREATRIAGEVGLMSHQDFSEPWERRQWDVSGYVQTIRDEQAAAKKPKRKPAGRGKPTGPPHPLNGLPEATDADTGRARLEAMEAAYRKSGGVQHTSIANGLQQALAADDLTFSPDGGIAAYANDGHAVAISTGSGATLRPLDAPEPASVDQLVRELNATGIPFGDRDALAERWSNRDRKVADQQAVTRAWGTASLSEDDSSLPEFDPNEPGSALARLGAIADRDRHIAETDDGPTGAAAAARADNIDAFFRSERSFDSESGRFVGYYPVNGAGSRSPVFMDATTGDTIPAATKPGVSVEDVLAQLDATDGDLSKWNPDAPDAGGTDTPNVVLPDGITDPAYGLYDTPQQDANGTWRIGPPGSHQATSGFQQQDRAQERLDSVRAMYDAEAARRQQRFGDLTDDQRGERLTTLARKYSTTNGTGTDVRAMTDEDLTDYRDLLAAARDDQLVEAGRRKLAEANAELASRAEAPDRSRDRAGVIPDAPTLAAQTIADPDVRRAAVGMATTQDPTTRQGHERELNLRADELETTGDWGHITAVDFLGAQSRRLGQGFDQDRAQRYEARRNDPTLPANSIGRTVAVATQQDLGRGNGLTHAMPDVITVERVRRRRLADNRAGEVELVGRNAQGQERVAYVPFDAVVADPPRPIEETHPVGSTVRFTPRGGGDPVEGVVDAHSNMGSLFVTHNDSTGTPNVSVVQPADAEVVARPDGGGAPDPGPSPLDDPNRTRPVAETHPIGSLVDARQPGIETVTRGTITGYDPNGMLRVQYENRRGEQTVGTFNPSHTDVVERSDGQGGGSDPAPAPGRAPDGSSDPLPTYGDGPQEEWAVDPDGEVVARTLGEEEGDRITLMVIPTGVVGSPTNTWRWEVRGRGERQSGVHTDRAEAMRLADEALASRSSDPLREEAAARERNTPIPDSFGDDQALADTLGQYLGLTDPTDVQRLRRVFGNGHKRVNPDFAAANRLRDRVGAEKFDALTTTLAPSRRTGEDRTFDGKRAADALRRFQAKDPSLPVHSVGQKVTVSVLAEGPQPLLPNARNPLIYRDVTGTVVDVKPSTTSSFMITVRPDNDADRELDMNGRPFSVVVQTVAGDAALRLADKPADLPDDLPKGDPPPLPDRPPTVSGSKRAADLAVGDRVLVDNDPVTITGSRREADGTLVLSYTGDDNVEWDLSIDDAETLPTIGGGETPLPPLPDEGPEGSDSGAEDTGDDAMLGGNLKAGDRYRLYDGSISNVISVRDDGDPDVVMVTTERYGVRDTAMMGRGAVLNRVNTADLPDPDPVTDDQPTARPALYTYQRRRAVSLGLDNDEDPLVAQAARRVRTRQPLTAEQSQALADRLRTISGDPAIKVQQQRALARLAMSFDAANAQARGVNAPEPSFAGGAKAEKGTLRDLTEGDHVAFTNLRGATVGGKLVGIRSKMSGRLYEVEVEGPDGTRQTHLLNRDTSTYRLPDLPDPVVIGNPPPARSGPVREHISADRVRPGDTISFAPNGTVTLTGRVVRMEKAPNGLWIPVIERPAGESRTDPLRFARDGEPSLIRTERGEGSADQPWDAVLPDENPTEVTAAGLRVGDRVSLPQAAGFPFVGVVEEIDDVTAEDDDGTANAARILTIRQDSGDTMSHHVLATDPLTRLTAADEDAGARIQKMKAERLMQRRVTAVADRLQTSIAEQIENMVGYGKMGSGNGRQAAWSALHNYNTSNGAQSAAQSVLRSLRGYRAEAPDRDEPQVKEVTAMLQNLYIERLGKLQMSLMDTPMLDGEKDHEVANRVLDQWRDTPPIERDLHAIARSLVLAQDAIDAQGGNQRVGGDSKPGVPDLPEGADLGVRMKAYRAALPENLAGFNKVTVRRASYGNLDADALERGEVPSITMSTGSGEIDRAPDGGPGEQTMAHLDVVLAAGRDLRQARDRKIADKLAGENIPDAATMKATEERLEAERSTAYRAAKAREAALRDELAQGKGFANWEDMSRAIYGRDVDPEVKATARQLYSDIYRLEDADEEYQRLLTASRAAADVISKNREANRAATKRRASAEREAALEVLAEARTMGGVKLNYSTAGRGASAGKPLTDRSELVQSMRFAESNYPADWLERAKTMFGGQPFKLKSIGRGHYSHFERTIALSKEEEKVEGGGNRGRVATHELGHAMERAVPGLAAAEYAFLYSRTSSGEIGSRTRSRKSRIYSGPKEVGYKDEFPEHYTGKVYDRMGRGEENSDAYEVFTTGVESLLAGSPYLDEGFTEFMLGTMALL